MENNLQGRTAVVTGGASGIGYAIAYQLSRSGANIVIADLQEYPKVGGYESDGRSIVEVIRELGGQAIFVKTDVTQVDAMETVANKAVEHFGQLDIWVNNAGIVAPQKLLIDYHLDEFDRCMKINLWGTWNGMRSAIRTMLKQKTGGSIINVLSTAALRPHAGQSIYDISKAAAGQATRCAALEFGDKGIRVNGVCPTITKTSLTKAFAETDAFKAWAKTVLPLGDLVNAQQVAQSVLFLASDASSAVTGLLMPVDMGEMIGPVQPLKMDD